MTKKCELKLKTLRTYGFVLHANWKCQDGQARLVQKNGTLNNSPAVYAFSDTQKAPYVGATHKLGQRINNYNAGKTSKSGSTNKKIWEAAKVALKSGCEFRMYVLDCSRLNRQYKTMTLNLAYPIEKWLRGEYDLRLNNQ